MSGGSAILALPESSDDVEVVAPRKSKKQQPLPKTQKVYIHEDEDEKLIQPKVDLVDLQLEDSLRQQGMTDLEIAKMREMIRRRANRPEPMG